MHRASRVETLTLQSRRAAPDPPAHTSGSETVHRAPSESLTFHLGEGGEQPEEQTALGCAGVDSLREGAEVDAT